MQTGPSQLSGSLLRSRNYEGEVQVGSHEVGTPIEGLYRPHIARLPSYEPYMSLSWRHLVTTHWGSVLENKLP